MEIPVQIRSGAFKPGSSKKKDAEPEGSEMGVQVTPLALSGKPVQDPNGIPTGVDRLEAIWSRLQCGHAEMLFRGEGDPSLTYGAVAQRGGAAVG